MDVKTLFHLHGITLKEWAKDHDFHPSAVAQIARECFVGTTRKPGLQRGKKREITNLMENQINEFMRANQC